MSGRSYLLIMRNAIACIGQHGGLNTIGVVVTVEGLLLLTLFGCLYMTVEGGCVKLLSVNAVLDNL